MLIVYNNNDYNNDENYHIYKLCIIICCYSS